MFEKIMVKISDKPVSILIERDPKALALAKSAPRQPCFVVGLSSHYHDKFSEEFRSFYQLVLIDLYWTEDQFTPQYVNKLNMDMLSNHIEQVRTQLESRLGESYQKIFIAAHSAYGFISIDYALKHPDKLLGAINISAPLIFNEEVLQEWQEEYMASNFGSAKAGGPTDRFHTYHAQKKSFAEQKAEQNKHYFVNWYTSMGTLFWHKPELWQNKDKQAAKIWDPWKIFIVETTTGTVKLETRDMNMPMMFRYLELVKDMNYYKKLSKIEAPVLWVIALGDSRVSLYQLDPLQTKDIPNNIEFYHPANAGHWPMYPQDNSTAEFDKKAISWGRKILNEQNPNTPQNTNTPFLTSKL